MARPKVRDWMGVRQGHITIVARGPIHQTARQKLAMWVGRCDCGKERLVSSKELKRGRVRHCGKKGCKFKKPKRNGAGGYIRPGSDWLLSEEQAKQLRDQHCFVCGAEGPCGIGLVDPKQHYVPSNVFAICPVCTKFIGRTSLSAFLGWVKRMAKRHFPLLGTEKG